MTPTMETPADDSQMAPPAEGGAPETAAEDGKNHQGGFMNKCFDLQEAADLLSVQPSTLRRWAFEKKVESIKLGRRVVFRESSLEAFVQANVRKASDDRC